MLSRGPTMLATAISFIIWAAIVAAAAAIIVGLM
jgi:hypothetical protein